METLNNSTLNPFPSSDLDLQAALHPHNIGLNQHNQQQQQQQFPYSLGLNLPPPDPLPEQQLPNAMFGSGNQPNSSQPTICPETLDRRISSAGHLSAALPPATATTTNGAMPVPNPIPAQPSQTQPPGLAGMPVAPFEGSRSPPGSKNLSHVPCKFYRQGACQAGKACPFSHSNDPSTDQAPCKYFQKGNCKFGVKCALAHILPDGRRISRHSFNHLGLGVKTYVEPNHASRSALHSSLVQAQMIPHGRPQFGDLPDDYAPTPVQSSQSLEPNFSSVINESRFASPRLDELGPTLSPLASSVRTLGPLDATLPSSFDSNDVSNYARGVPIAASVPSGFGIGSPPISFAHKESHTLRSLRASAFGQGDSIGELAASPPTGELTLGLRLQSQLRGHPMSASLPRGALMLGDTWGGKDRFNSEKLQGGDGEVLAHEEDLIPGSLTGDILSPMESVVRNRRMSSTGREFHARLDPEAQTGSVVGSPPIGSPSRFGPLFTRTKREEEPISGLGHVGSPLRNSYLGSSPPFGAMHKANSSGEHERLSALTETLRRAKISRDNSFNSDIPASAKPNGKPMERAISSSSAGGGKGINSADEDTPFAMDEEESGVGKQSSLGPIPIAGLKRTADEDDWKTFAKKDVKPLR